MQRKQSFLDIVNEQLNSDETVLPLFDGSALAIREEIGKETPDLDAIVKLIGRDLSLTVQVLRDANSAFYEGLTKVSTIRNAIIRLGTGALSNILKHLMQRKDSCTNDSYCSEMMEKLWRHSIGCAMGAKWLAEQCHLDAISGEAFTAGLLHDVGKLFLMAVVEELNLTGKNDLKSSNALLGEVLENFHAEHGYLLLKNWNLPESYCKVVREHHWEEIDSNDTLLIMVRLANKACNKLGIGLVEDTSVILAATDEANVLGLSEVFLAKLEIKLEDYMIFSH